jgi:hypothetical protein
MVIPLVHRSVLIVAERVIVEEQAAADYHPADAR